VADESVSFRYRKNLITANVSLAVWMCWGIVEDSLVVAFGI
jgi:hypothetical protein